MHFSISDYITIVGIVVGLIGIVVGIIGIRCLNVAMKIKNIANNNKDSNINQAQNMTVNQGLKTDEVIELTERTVKKEIDNIPVMSNEEIDKMMQDH